ncbi:MAG: hypothetical protein RLO12_13535, partial [Fulvivirga sp.]
NAPLPVCSLAFSSDNLLAMVFYKLGNHQKAFEFVAQESDLYNHLVIASFIQLGQVIEDGLVDFAKNTSNHNYAILLHYGQHAIELEHHRLVEVYEKALENSANDELRLFTAKHYINHLLDVGAYDQAVLRAEYFMKLAISEEAIFAMKEHLSAALMSKLEMPFEKEKLDEIEQLQLSVITFYEERKLKVKAGLILIDASEVANYKQDYPSSKDNIMKAILYFREENMPEFLGEATVRKATLLYTWSKNGSPQYYKPSINAYQDALKVFKRDTHPERFADIQHNLGLIYSEIPVGPDEQAIWSAFCASAFKEALSIYDKTHYPYQFATVAHNYATALINFPEAKIHNNLNKANGLFNEALEIRTSAYPFERASTLLNQLELYWLLNNENEQQELEKLEQMFSKVNEVKQLTTDEALNNRADDMLIKLQELKPMLK